MTTPASVLSDATILRLVSEGRIRIDPWDETLVQPASVDLRLGDSFRVFHNHRASAIDLRDPPANLTEEVKIAGDESFVIHPGEFCLARTLEWVELPDDIVARIEGKALALDTPVPTPTGWTTVGELEVGDDVFDSTGRPTRIVGATRPLAGRECRDVTFSDGTRVVADIDHQWAVLTNYERRHGLRPRVVTTREIQQGLRAGAEHRFHVAQAGPVRYPERDLPIDPYVLGVWLGDGTAIAQAEVTTVDRPILGGWRSSAASGLGLLGHEQIPVEYLQASVPQRRALLAGVMDAGGCVDALGRCDIATPDYRRARQHAELIASLGYRPVIATKLAGRDDGACGFRHEVTFTPHDQVFRLPRKQARLALTQRFESGRAIVDVVPATSVSVRCVEVAAPDGVFLITPAFIPTHNSSLGRLGLIVHATAGFCDPGWRGTLTLELNNLTRIPIKLYAGLPIAQLSFMTLDAPARRPYGSRELGSHYQGQVGATESRYEGSRTGPEIE